MELYTGTPVHCTVVMELIHELSPENEKKILVFYAKKPEKNFERFSILMINEIFGKKQYTSMAPPRTSAL